MFAFNFQGIQWEKTLTSSQNKIYFLRMKFYKKLPCLMELFNQNDILKF